MVRGWGFMGAGAEPLTSLDHFTEISPIVWNYMYYSETPKGDFRDKKSKKFKNYLREHGPGHF